MQQSEISNRVLDILVLRMETKKTFTQKDLVLDFFKTAKKEYTFYGLNAEQCNGFVRTVRKTVESLCETVVEILLKDLADSQN